MYKHNAFSIKETAEKRFISKVDKDRYNAISSECIDVVNSYNKEDIDKKITNRLNKTEANIKILSELGFPHLVKDVECGYLDDIEIFGNSENVISSKHKLVTLTAGYTFDESGNQIEGPNIISMDHISVNYNQEIELCGTLSGDTNRYEVRNVRALMFDSNKKLLYITDYGKKIDIPYGVRSIKIECNETTMKLENPITYLIVHDKKRQIVSVGDIQDNGTYRVKVKSIGKNLVDVTKAKNYNSIFADGAAKLVNSSTDEKVYQLNHCIRLKPNTKYTLSANYTKDEYCKHPEIYVYTHIAECNDLSTSYWYKPNKIEKYSDGKLYGSFTTGERDIYARIRFDHNGTTQAGQESVITYSNVMLYEGDYEPDLEYEDYTEREVEITVPCQLQKAGSIYDRLVINDSKMYIEKNVKELTLTPNNANYILHSMESENFPQSMLVYAIHSDNSSLLLKPNTDVLCDILDNGIYYSKDECIFNGTYALAIQIDRRRLNGEESLFGFMEWLKDNPIKIIYATTEPTFIECDNYVKPLLETIKGDMYIESGTGVTLGGLMGTVPLSLGASLNRNINNIKILKDEVKTISNTVKQSAFSIENDKHVTTIKSNGGLLDGIEIKGKTLVNAIDEDFYKADISLSSNDGRYSDHIFNHLVAGGEGTVTVKDGFIEVTKEALSEQEGYTNFFLKKSALHVKPNTIYTYIIEVLYNDLKSTDNDIVAYFGNSYNINDPTNSQASVFTKYNWGLKLYKGQVGIFKFPVYTRPKEELDILEDRYVGDRGFIRNVASGSIKLRIALVEGNHVDTDIKKISPKLITVADDNKLKVTTNNVNLLDIHDVYETFPSKTYYSIEGDTLIVGDGITSLHDFSCVKYWVYLEGGKQYMLKYKATIVTGNDRVVVDYKYRTKNKDDKSSSGIFIASSNNLNEFVIDPVHGDGWYQIGFFATYGTAMAGRVMFKNIGLYEITDNIEYDYTNNERNEVTIDLSKYGIEGGLKSLPDGTCDRIFKNNGKYYLEQNVGSVVLDSSLGWYYSDYYADIDALQEGVNCYTLNVDPVVGSYPVCDKLPGVSNRYTELKDCNISIAVSSTGKVAFYVRVPGKRLSSIDHEGFKEWLKENPLTVHYKMKYPNIIELSEDLDMKLFDKRTRLEIESGTLNPKVNIYHSGTLQNTIQELLSDIRCLSATELTSAKLTLNSIYVSDLTNYMIDVSVLSDLKTNICDDYDYELFELIYNIIINGKYSIVEIEEKIDFFCIINKLSFDMCDILFNLICYEE